MKPMFSIIMASYMGSYKGSASNREEKLLRAIDSVRMQSFADWELIVVADGCERTMELVEQHYGDARRIRSVLIPKQELWAPGVRNRGLKDAIGTWACYLDTDDYFGLDHLRRIADGLSGVDTCWAWFNDLIWDRRAMAFVERECDITHRDKHGTSNLVHRLDAGAWWTHGTYKQDAFFAMELKSKCDGPRIATPEYCVAHIPGRYDV